MKRLLAAFVFVGMATAFAAPISLSQKQELAKTSLKVGDTAPDFTSSQRSVEAREAERLQRQEKCLARDLRPRIHRWLNETTPGRAVWNNRRKD